LAYLSLGLYDIATSGSLDNKLSDALQERSRETEELFKVVKLPSEAANESPIVTKYEILQAEVRKFPSLVVFMC
jgi:hypothetical protein